MATRSQDADTMVPYRVVLHPAAGR